MLVLENGTDLAATHFVTPDVDGVEAVFAVLKGAYRLRDGALVPEEEPPELDLEDVWQEEPATSGLVRATDVSLPKPGTDLLVTGFAVAEGGRRAPFVDVSLAAAGLQRYVRVWGDRFWRGDGTHTEPEAFEMMPLAWERAWGGAAPEGFPPDADARNPVGIGFRPRGSSAPTGRPLPNLEDPYQPIMSWDDTPPPACTAPVASHWEPRRSRAGTYDTRWQKSRAPFLPDDFDRRFLQAAPEGQFSERPLSPGEWVEVRGITRSGRAVFQLPTLTFRMQVQVGGMIEEVAPTLGTVLVHGDGEEVGVTLTWHGGVRTGRRTTKVRRVVLTAREA